MYRKIGLYIENKNLGPFDSTWEPALKCWLEVFRKPPFGMLFQGLQEFLNNLYIEYRYLHNKMYTYLLPAFGISELL